jgi:hypothetical protein
MAAHRTIRGLLFPLLLALAACAELDPYSRVGTWQPEGVNDRNLAAMVANPADLLRGHGASGADSPLAIAAANRLFAGRPKPLPDANSQETKVGASNPAASGGSVNGGS